MDTNLFNVLLQAAKEGGGTSTWQMILLALIAALPPTLVALAGLVKSRQVCADVREVHLSVKSLQDARKTAAEIAAKIEVLQAELAERVKSGNPS